MNLDQIGSSVADLVEALPKRGRGLTAAALLALAGCKGCDGDKSSDTADTAPQLETDSGDSDSAADSGVDSDTQGGDTSGDSAETGTQDTQDTSGGDTGTEDPNYTTRTAEECTALREAVDINVTSSTVFVDTAGVPSTYEGDVFTDKYVVTGDTSVAPAACLYDHTGAAAPETWVLRDEGDLNNLTVQANFPDLPPGAVALIFFDGEGKPIVSGEGATNFTHLYSKDGDEMTDTSL